MMYDNVLKNDERAVLSLRSLYKSYGYQPFKMSKFEEYDLYARNKDFLVSDRIITFTDTDGRLMALKPDVTLSIIKSGVDSGKRKVYYDENVYRVSESTGQFKEIRQTGLECIGDVDLYDVYETVSLAAESLGWISEEFVLEVSHLGILSEVLDSVCPEESFQRDAIGFIAEKNRHDLEALCEEWGVSESDRRRIVTFVSVYGARDKVLRALEGICEENSEALRELKLLSRMLDTCPAGEKILFDFSVVNDMNYYNGIVFRGFVRGICEGVLAGGRYDNLMRKLGRRSGAVGFALYLDLLEQMATEKKGYDVDVLLLYREEDDLTMVDKKVRELVAQGLTVSAQRGISEKLRAKRVLSFGKEETKC